jgi:MoaA/NifB/PqqE/SkfB family radical SAM enzyme
MSACDIEADWHLLHTCNFRCEYCFCSPELLGRKLHTYASPQIWTAAFEATGMRWLIHMTGGEPTIYPEFVELCEGLTRAHMISLNTNLSNPCIKEFARRIDPKHVSFINAGFHAEEREARQGVERYFDHARCLQDSGFRIITTVVATPPVVARFAEFQAQFAAHGLWLAPKVLRGEYRGRRYPQGYSPADRASLRSAIIRAREHYQSRLDWPGARGWPSIDVLSDDELLASMPSFGGQPCSAGMKFVGIAPNGDVHRCSKKTLLGNLLLGTLRLRSGPTPCDTTYCVYFCKKYTADAAASPAPVARPRVLAPVSRKFLYFTDS